MTFGKGSFIPLLALSMCLPISTFASKYADLVVNNNTDEFSTSMINGKQCSTDLPEGYGVTKPREQNHRVPGVVIYSTCWPKLTDCHADLYMTNDCNASGAKPIASAIFNVNTGIQSINVYAQNYQITHGNFNITVSKR